VVCYGTQSLSDLAVKTTSLAKFPCVAGIFGIKPTQRPATAIGKAAVAQAEQAAPQGAQSPVAGGAAHTTGSSLLAFVMSDCQYLSERPVNKLLPLNSVVVMQVT
jgi:hypothetical protein